MHRAVLAGDSPYSLSFPGPLIYALKSRVCCSVGNEQICPLTHLSKQGDSFSLNVVNELTDSTMLKSTSIVSFFPFHFVFTIEFRCPSTGTDFIRKEAVGQMALSVLPSALLPLATPSCINSPQPTKRDPFGIILTIVCTYF